MKNTNVKTDVMDAMREINLGGAYLNHLATHRMEYAQKLVAIIAGVIVK